MADRIVRAQALPRWALTDTIADLVADPQGIPGSTDEAVLREIESELRVVADTNCPSPMNDVDLRELEAIWSARKDDFFRGVGYRLVRTRKDDESTA